MACCRKVPQKPDLSTGNASGTIIGPKSPPPAQSVYTNRSAVKSNRAPVGKIAYSCPTCGSKSILKTCPICGTVINS